jgi:hypothetical protein
MGRPKRTDWQERFLSVYEESCVIRFAARAAGIGERTFYRELARNPEFEERFEGAKKAAVARLEQVAYERAMDHSDTLLIFLLKANRPAKYRERIGVDHGGTIKHEVDEALDDEIERFLAANDDAGPQPDGGSDQGPPVGNGSKPRSDAT